MAYHRAVAKTTKPRRGRPAILRDVSAIGVDLEREVHDALREWAAEREISVSEAVRRILRRAVGPR